MGSTFKKLGERQGGVVTAAGQEINLISHNQIADLCNAIKQAKSSVTVEPADPQIDVTVEPTPPAVVNVDNNVETPKVEVNSQVVFPVKHLYLALVVQAILIFAIGIGLYVGISEFNKPSDPTYGPQYEPSE